MTHSSGELSGQVVNSLQLPSLPVVLRCAVRAARGCGWGEGEVLLAGRGRVRFIEPPGYYIEDGGEELEEHRDGHCVSEEIR